MYRQEFTQEAVQLTRQAGGAITQMASELGIDLCTSPRASHLACLHRTRSADVSECRAHSLCVLGVWRKSEH